MGNWKWFSGIQITWGLGVGTTYSGKQVHGDAGDKNSGTVQQVDVLGTDNTIGI